MRHVARAFLLADERSKEEGLLEETLNALAEKEGLDKSAVSDYISDLLSTELKTVHSMGEIVEELLSADERFDSTVKTVKVRGGKKGYGKKFEVVVQIDVKELDG